MSDIITYTIAVGTDRERTVHPPTNAQALAGNGYTIGADIIDSLWADLCGAARIIHALELKVATVKLERSDVRHLLAETLAENETLRAELDQAKADLKLMADARGHGIA